MLFRSGLAADIIGGGSGDDIITGGHDSSSAHILGQTDVWFE